MENKKDETDYLLSSNANAKHLEDSIKQADNAAWMDNYKPSGSFWDEQSSKNMEKLYERGLEVFGDKDIFKDWMITDIIALGNKKPIDLIDTPEGIQSVLTVLGRIEHGIF